ncbi:GNAT family N-acetyltransferase [Bacillus carboniphilus]|uniref:GNAT family N-acetyltransferase n=1 Tax=Bacillus carboniphilus TaxID=86663 RepID=A0ABY9JWU2_9BACI|nr:GNAT family N-acetyltransferase [Bacillus carboniphilus]WLR42095.1 GNAT family N-acetyltransferase [Bacillus carboniphilus]
MIVELQKNEFHKCREFLNPTGQVEAFAVVEGTNPGRIFVDNMDVPKSGLIWLGSNDGFLFIGDEKNETFNCQLDEFIDKTIVSKQRKFN